MIVANKHTVTTIPLQIIHNLNELTHPSNAAEIQPTSCDFQTGVDAGVGTLRICLGTFEFLEFLRSALRSARVITECAQQGHLTLPGPLGLGGGFVCVDSGGGLATVSSTVAAYMGSDSTCHGQLAWELRAVEITMEPDFTAVGKPYGLNPPASLDPETQNAWWRHALSGLVDIIDIVQRVQFTKATNAYITSWGQLPLVIWAKPVSVQQPGAPMYRI